MSQAAAGFVSGTSRPLLLRRRPDLVVRRQTYLGRDYWVIKDPIGQKYYRFEEEEFALLQMLDGRCSLDDLRGRFEHRFAPQKISLYELHQLVSTLHRNALVVSDAPGQGPALLKRSREQARRRRWGAWSNVLSLRFKGIDPDRLLTWLDRRIGWFFSLPVLFFCLALAVSALLLVSVQFDVFRARLPAFHEFFASRNWLWLALTLGATKVLHEFGHGLACKRFGGECHEMGVMLLVLTPCLYCNVSDSWMLPSKWRRAAIGAAGMYVEIVLASICTFLWWFSEPGLFNYLCLNVMFISSVSTLLFNANPLLRYDGYYILADVIEIPNLRQKSSTILRRKLGSWCLGIEAGHDPFLPHRRQGLFAVYAVAAAVYRWVVVIGILWFLNQVFKPYGLQVLGQALAAVSIYGLLVHPLVQLVRYFRVPGRLEQVKWPRCSLAMAVGAALVAAVALVPLPHYVRCEVELQPGAVVSRYVESPGTIQQIHVRPGDSVQSGHPLITLANHDLQIRLVQLEAEKRHLQTRLESLRQRAYDDPGAGAQIAEVEESVTAIEEQLAQQRRDMQRLRIVAPRDGVVMAPPRQLPPEAADQLPTWSGTPLERKNLAAYLPNGTLVCQVGDPRRIKAVMAVDQSDIERVRPGQRVELFLEQLPGRRLVTRVEQLSQENMQFAPHRLAGKAGGALATETDAGGRERPQQTTYQASALLEDTGGELLLGATGRARIRAGSLTLVQRAWRFLCHTFSFDV